MFCIGPTLHFNNNNSNNNNSLSIREELTALKLHGIDYDDDDDDDDNVAMLLSVVLFNGKEPIFCFSYCLYLEVLLRPI